jgi:hypothetical protein
MLDMVSLSRTCWPDEFTAGETLSCHPPLRIGSRALIYGVYISMGLACSHHTPSRSFDPVSASPLRSERVNDVHLQPHHQPTLPTSRLFNMQ